MPCPNCSHTLDGVGSHGGMIIHHCMRCGTMTHTNGEGTHVAIYTPKLLLRCRDFESTYLAPTGPIPVFTDWHKLGISESIHLPADRRKS